MNNGCTALLVDGAQAIDIVTHVNAKFAGRAQPRFVFAGKAEVDEDGLTVRTIPRLHSAMNRWIAEQEVEFETENLHKVLSCTRYIRNPEDRLNTVQLVDVGKVFGHRGKRIE